MCGGVGDGAVSKARARMKGRAVCTQRGADVCATSGAAYGPFAACLINAGGRELPPARERHGAQATCLSARAARVAMRPPLRRAERLAPLALRAVPGAPRLIQFSARLRAKPRSYGARGDSRRAGHESAPRL